MRYIVLSVNQNQDYYYYMPLVCWSWQRIGWNPIVLINGEVPDVVLNETIERAASTQFVSIKDIEGYRSDTVTQISRIYAACLDLILPDDIVMTGDIDMAALSSYWSPESAVTIYGHDLTGYGHYPICYISATKSQWRAFMGITSNNIDDHIKRDLDLLPQAKDPDFYQYWFSDQDLVTDRIKQSTLTKVFVNRGQRANGYALGRIDRGSWSVDHDQFIDAHLHRDIFKAYWTNHPDRDTFLKKYMDTLRMLEKCWPTENFEWFKRYTAMFLIMTEGK